MTQGFLTDMTHPPEANSSVFPFVSPVKSEIVFRPMSQDDPGGTISTSSDLGYPPGSGPSSPRPFSWRGGWGRRRRPRALAGAELASIAFAFHDDLVGVVGQPVQSALGQDGIIEERDPLLHCPVARKDGGGSSMALDDDLVDVTGLGGVQPSKAKIVHDQDVRGEEAPQCLLAGVIRLRLP